MGLRQRRVLRRTVSLLVIVAALALTGPATAAAAPVARESSPAAYLALGDSLSVGVQPDRTGTNRETADGYPEQLHRLLRLKAPRLSLAKLGCSGETSQSMIDGGSCPYPAGSKLAEAEQFLRSHGRTVALVTVDIGANDFLACQQRVPADQHACTAAVSPRVAQIANRLRAAAAPGTAVVGMTYYIPQLVTWFDDPGQARVAAEQVHAANAALAAAYASQQVLVADVETAFRSLDFTPVQGRPLNVRILCELTWLCAYRNIHANASGYRLIAATFAITLARSGALSGPPHRLAALAS